MHSRIFEIRDYNFSPEEWADDITIADGNGNIDGADYWNEYDEATRNWVIYDFFEKCFPDNSFRIVKNEPCKTAVVQFRGDINALYRKWIAEIKKASENLNEENVSSLGVYDITAACTRPFGLCSKFYMDDWCGCTSDACDFLELLKHLSSKSKSGRFNLYIGQVFDYHW